MKSAALFALAACGARASATSEPAPMPGSDPAAWIHVVLDGDRAMRAGLEDGFAGDPAFALDRRPADADGFRVVGRVEGVELVPQDDGTGLVICEASIVVTTEPGGAMIATQRSSARVEVGGSEAAAGEVQCLRSLARFLVDDELRPLLHERTSAP